MADLFDDQLRAELDGIQAELDRLASKRRLIEELLSIESGAAGPSAPMRPRKRAVRRRARSPKRSRLPRGLTSGKIREFLGGQCEPVHATEILAYLEQRDAAPRWAKPMATLQSSLQRLKETGELENTGRNHWRLRSPEAEADVPAPTTLSAGPLVVTSTTSFGSGSSIGI